MIVLFMEKYGKGRSKQMKSDNSNDDGVCGGREAVEEEPTTLAVMG